MSYTLLTGCTGHVGHYLLRDLQRAGIDVVVLVRPANGLGAGSRLGQTLQIWREQGMQLRRPVVVEGDLNHWDCGLSPRVIQWLASNCSQVVHCAASVAFDETLEGEPFRSNVDGTRHLLHVCRLANVRDFHYVSTAYVCGLRQGRVWEREQDVEQPFRNAYEKSKALAERMVLDADFLRHKTIYRPPFIAGDSRTGYSSSFHGIFRILRLISLIVQQLPTDQSGVRLAQFRLPSSGNERRNCVPIDWVSSVVTRMIMTQEARGSIYHITSLNGITARQLLDFTNSYYNSSGVSFGRSDEDVANQLEQLASEYLEVYQPYESGEPEFDTTNLMKFAADLPCPEIDEPMVHRFIDFGELSRWGKRRRLHRRERRQQLRQDN